MTDVLESIIRRLKQVESRVEFIGHLDAAGRVLVAFSLSPSKA